MIRGPLLPMVLGPARRKSSTRSKIVDGTLICDEAGRGEKANGCDERGPGSETGASPKGLRAGEEARAHR